MRLLSGLLLSLLGIAVALIIAEASVRIYRYFNTGTSFLLNPGSRWDAELGWKGKESLIAGDPGKGTILVIGDSFTEGLSVKPDDMWYADLKYLSGESVTAYGGQGYSTFQELLILKKYLSEGLKPSLIVLQLCTNDIINNYFPLEKLSLLQRAPAPRPYFEHGKSVMRFPRNFGLVLGPIKAYSRLVHFLNTKWEMRSADLAGKKEIRTVEWDIQENGFNMPLFREAVSVTHKLLEEFKKETRGAKLIFILADDVEPYTRALETSAEKLGVPLVIPRREESFTEEELHEDGTHLNRAGNRHLGNIARKFIQQS